jgi:colanic acid biosynthesis protein WcaH
MAFLPPEVFSVVVRSTPLVSIDLLVRDAEGRLLVGRRRNQPARGCWFVPGGRIGKDERLADAFARITGDELGVSLRREHSRFVGVFEHFYPENALEAPGFGTHYVVLAHELVRMTLTTLPAAQHAAYRWLGNAALLADPEVHENTKAYCR